MRHIFICHINEQWLFDLRAHSVGEKMPIPETHNNEGTVIERENRFLVTVRSGNEVIRCHLHDPGRLKDLIFPGNRVLFRKTDGIRTQYSITCAWHEGDWILTDSRFHNHLASFFLPEGTEREVKVGRSRIDFRNDRTYIEVKGCSMRQGDMAVFPDAPTVRGTHHLSLLTDLMGQGYESMLIVLIFSWRSVCFSPNFITDPEFGKAFMKFMDAGGRVFLPKFSFDGKLFAYAGEAGMCRDLYM